MIAIGTRFWGKDLNKDLPRLVNFLEHSIKLGHVFVAVNIEEDRTDTLAFLLKNYPEVDAFAVTPWQKFVAPFNAIVYRAAVAGHTKLLLASAEFPPTENFITSLEQYLDKFTLVAGTRLPEHSFAAGSQLGNGATNPWNTFALWNLEQLAKIGFVLAGDAPSDPKQAGAEEIVTIAIYQKLFPLQAKLISIPKFYTEWGMEGWDEERHKRHQVKIASKISRAEKQLEWTKLPAPIILHIEHNTEN